MKKYNAFISYTHKSEMPLALALDAALTRFAKPWNKLRALRIYRDTDSQALTTNLLAAVEQAMAASEFLILLASPSSAVSTWVPREIDYWVKTHPLDKLLIVVCDGEVIWDDTKGDFDWAKTDCLPESLKGVYEGAPLYLDMRWSRGRDDLDLRDPDFKDAVARLSAALNGKSKEDMLSEELTQFRRTTRIRNFAIMALSVLFVSAAVAATLAVLARNEAVFQRDQALKSLMRIEVQNALGSDRLGHAVQLARTAREVFDEDPQVRDIAWDITSHPTAVIYEVADLDYQFARVSADGKRMLMGWQNDNRSLDVTVQDRLGHTLLTLDSVFGARFLGDGSKLHVLEPSAPLLMVANDANPEDADPGSICGNEVDFTPAVNDGGLAFDMIDFQGEVVTGAVYDLNTLARIDTADITWYGEPVHVCGDYLRVFTESGEFQKWVHKPGAEKAIASADLQFIAVQVGDKTQIVDVDGRVSATVSGVDPVFSPDGSMVATVSYQDSDELRDYFDYTGADNYPFEESGLSSQRSRGESPDDAVYEMVVYPDDANFDAGLGNTSVWSIDGKQLASLPGTHPFFTPNGVITSGGLAIDGEPDWNPRLWSLQAGPDGRHEMRLEMDGFHVVSSPDGRWIASGDDEGFKTWIWDIKGRFHAEVEGGKPVFVPGQDVLITNLHGRVRQWYLPRLRSKSRFIMADLIGIPPATVADTKGLVNPDKDSNDCDRHCEPGEVYDVEVTGEVAPEFSITPGTMQGGKELVSIIRITRGAVELADTDGNMVPPSIVYRVAGCDAQSERYLGNLLLLACADDDTWRIYDLDASGGIDDTEDHHALMWGNHGPNLSKAVFSENGRRVLSMSREGLLRLWDISGGNGEPDPIDLQLGAEVRFHAISDNSELLAAIPVSGPARIWNFEGDHLANLSTRGSDEYFTGLRFFNQGRHLVFSGLDSQFEYFYIPWTIAQDEMFEGFNWLPSTDDAEIERLGLADRERSEAE